RFNDFVNQSGITLTLLPPQYYLQTEFTGLKVLTTGGSASNAEVIHKAAASQSRYVNAYGPTENTVLATHWEQDGTSEIPHPVPIGRPIANSQIFILNGMNLCGIGIPGELCIAGDGVARGYLNKPELTAERFIPNPFGEGKLYRSGDLAKWLPDGNIEYLGRIDEQVKIRGFRIELGEIENALRKIDSLQDAAVITRADASGDQALYAYLVADETLRLSDIRDALNRSLPDYMIPAHMMQIDSLPVTRSGKLDRKALPEIEASGERGYVAPRNDIEETLCQVFGQILGAEIVGAKDNFFELGGDSIKAIRIVSKMRSAGYSLSVKEIMSRHTVEAIAHAVVDASGNHYEQNEVTGTVLPTPILEEFASWQLAKPHHFNQDMMLQVELDDEIQLQKVLTALAVHHDIIRSVYRNGRLEILSSRESDLYDFKAFDLRQEESVSAHIEAACTDLQSSIDLERGPLMKAALFCTAEGNFLFLCLHHLVVDGVSWRILLEDLNTALGQVKEGQKISFPAKTASFKEWAEALAEYKTGRPMQKERAYWEQVVSEMEAGRIAVETGTDETGPASIAISLSAEETEQLVQRAGKAYNTEMNDLLIGAIGLSVKRLTGQDVVSIGLEGHGREEIHKPIDIDRTIGWFTTKYPIVVACCAEVNEAIVQTKEMLRKVPNHGLGYGLLQQELQAPSVDLLFNYLGQMDAESKTGKASFFSAGKSSADENITPGKISFNGYISEGVLSLVLAYDKGSVSGLAMEEFAALYKQSLLEIIEHCLAQKETRKTPSDYSTNDLTGEDLTVLQNAFEKPSRIEDIYSLTPLQQGMLFHNLADKQSTGYVVQNVLSVRGEVEEEKIKQALKLLTLRHDALRTAIVHDDLSQPRQVLLHDREVGYDKTDLQGLDEQEQQTAIADLAKRHVKHGFDLQNDPLLRVHYIVQSDDRHKLIWNYHHIIMDGWCLSILYGDFNRFYRLLRNGTSLSELERMVAEEKRQTASYGEYIQWMERQDHEAGLSYWEDLLADYEETADIKPVQKPEPTDEQVRREVVKLSADTSKKLHQIAAAHQLTVNNLVEASWGLVLQAYSGTRDVVFGKVVSGRQADVRGIEGILGLFINTMPTRVRSRDGMTVSELWKDLQKQGTESDPHSYCSLAEIQSSSQQKNDLIRVAYAFDNYFVDGEKLKVEDGALAFEVESSREQTNYDITLCAYQKGENLIFDLMYNPNVYAQEEIQRVLARVEVVLQAMAANPDEKLAAIDTITEPERVRILDVFNDTATDYPRDRSVVELLEEQVRTFPQKTALVVGEERLTYAELNRKANRLAAKLRELGVKPDDFVAILTERKVETIIGICGILKAGGAYVPIDPTYPEDRIRFILEDCRPKAVLHVQAELETDLPAFDLTDGKLWEGPSDDPEPVNKPGDLAYCIYTSGTTGKPKGTLIEHKSVIRLVKDTNYVELDDTRVILQTGSMSFDASTFEVWGALLHGGTLVLADQEVITDDKTLKEYLLRYEVTTMWLTASLYNLMIQSDAGMFDSLTELLIGGEKLSEEHVRLLKSRKKNVKLINGYGPTENTTFTATYEIPEQFDLIPIGNPIANTQVYILNGDKLCGIGIPGELCIAGDGLARGYLNRPDLTAEKFTANPFGEGKLYRSGDLARWRPDGLIEYLGRIDEQVKIRGFRIELGEIENALRKVETIRDAAVIARVEESGDKAICAYLVSDEEISFPALRDALSRSLPDYMIPAHMMQIESIPVTRNGKLDRRALPEIEASSDREYVAPRNDIEAALCQVFSQILGAETVGVKDSFFELGGDSIKAIRIVSKMRSAGYSLSVKEIMSKHTVEAIAHAVVDAGGNRYEQGEVTGTVLPTPILEEFASWPLAKPHHFNQDMMLQIELDDEIQLQQVLTALAVHHDIIRSVYRNGRLEILSSRESDLYDFKAFDLRQEKEVSACIEAACTDLQGSIDLEQGPLMKAALFCTAAGNFLFLCLHHLVVDGVSWRILLEDLNTALGQVKEGQPIRFPAKTASFKEWAESLAAYKTSRPLQKERTYWEQVVSGMEAGRIAVEESTDETGPASIAITLSAEDTERLVHRAGKAYHTEMNDLLISAIGRSVKRLTGQATVTVGLEGHGREEIHKPIDIDRTIGWFTTKYPIVVACCDDVKEAIVQTKEMLRKVPNHGLGYGLLQQELQAPSVDLTFNYLGQMDAESQAGKASFFSAGKSTADENTASGKISFNGYISDGVLHLVLAYDKGSVSGRTMETFAALYQESLVEIIEHCLAQKETVKTPSDYSASDLSGKDLSLLQDRFKNLSRVEDIYSLTPLQQGMLFHNLADKQSTGYVIQNVLSIQEEVEEEKIKQALQLLTRRHDVLRTAIVHDRLSKPRQVLLHDREVEYDRTDLSGLDEREQQTTIADLAARHVKRGFDLQEDPLLRVHHIVQGDNRHKLIWNYHHIIMDGWCLSILYGDFNRFYRLLRNGASLSDVERMIAEEKRQSASYGEYIQWVERQDRDLGLSYWEELLADYEETADIKPVSKPEPTDEQVRREVVKLSADISKTLLQTAAAHQLTVNNLVEAAWGIVLQAYSGTQDVVFGKVVSGRQADVKGIESILGMFINTIPTRVRSEADMTVLELWKNQQLQGTESDQYSYCSLADIQSLSQQKNELIKVIYAFENYFVDEEKLKVEEGALSFVVESAREQTNYDMTLSAYLQGDILVFDLLYNPNVYAQEEIQSILARMEVVLRTTAANPHGKLAAIEAITEQERVRILGEFNDTVLDYAKDRTVVDMF
ncbi:MAG TPA: amino acid adenylation domain-containing protein, partial [Bacilli bacterium]|nr:amino acid adenylation domain-containing protein [Bacilli bacterium]